MFLNNNKNLSYEEIKINSPRVVRALTDGNYDCVQSVYELIDNSIDASASKATVNIKGGEGGVTSIVVSDNGSGFKNDQDLKDCLILGNDRERELQEISEFGVGLKVGCLAQGDSLTIVSKTSEQQCIAVNVRREDFKFCALEADVAEKLWQEFHSEPESRTGTVIIVSELNKKHSYFRGKNSKKNLSKKLKEQLGQRYFQLIQKQNIQLYVTVNGGRKDGGPVQPNDPLCRNEEGVSEALLATDFAYKDIPYRLTATDLGPLSSNSRYGLYISVAGIMICRDEKSMLGIHSENASHSHHWNQSILIEFETKKDLLQIASLASNKHDVKLDDSGFSDHLKDKLKPTTDELKRLCISRSEEKKARQNTKDKETINKNLLQAIKQKRNYPNLDMYELVKNIDDIEHDSYSHARVGRFCSSGKRLVINTNSTAFGPVFRTQNCSLNKSNYVDGLCTAIAHAAADENQNFDFWELDALRLNIRSEIM
tara:strand:+ start:127 stop:1575 length:1449 start_codon:yes stop_codon:yes gene_type:complete